MNAPIKKMDGGGKPVLDEALFDREEVKDLFNTNSTVCVDLSDITHITSVCLSRLIKCYKDIKTASGDMFLYAPNPVIRSILQVTNMDKLFKISETLEASYE
jgi:anti-anti-sigma factor